jgi:hypothetical protein
MSTHKLKPSPAAARRIPSNKRHLVRGIDHIPPEIERASVTEAINAYDRVYITLRRMLGQASSRRRRALERLLADVERIGDQLTGGFDTVRLRPYIKVVRKSRMAVLEHCPRDRQETRSRRW